MTDDQAGQILRELVGVNSRLDTINGKVQRHEQWIAIRTDREQQEAEHGTKAVTTKQFLVTSAIGACVLIVAVIALLLGAHGVS